MFKLVHKNKKGVTLVELLVCVAILALVMPLAGQVLYSLTGLNGTMADRWHVQTAVRMACAEFEGGNDSLTNAFQVDVLYDPVVDAGLKIDDNGNIEWLNGVPSPCVMNAEGVKMESDLYTYIFSAPTWDKETDDYLGELLYIREYLSPNTTLLLGGIGFGYTPVEISFSLASTEFVSGDNVRYTDASIFVGFESGKDDMAKYSFQSAFAIINNTRSINRKDLGNGEALVFEQKWLDQEGNPKAYPAGWVDYDLNATPGSNYPSGMDVVNPDNSITTRHYAKYLDNKEAIQEVLITEKFDYDFDGNGKITDDEKGKHVITRAGNVLRYVSPTAQATQDDVATRKTGANIATCLTGWAMMGSGFEETVLTNLRAFRDDVLKGTAFGDWFIEQYYYVWSPFVVENLEALKPVIKAVLIPISYICGFVAKQ